MGVFKEHATSFETVAKRQSQIFTDAVDYGVAYNTNNVPADIALLFHYVNDLKGTSLQKSRQSWDDGVSITFNIGWEIDEGMECGTSYTITYSKISGYTRIDRTANAMVSVEIKNYREKI